jgi:hypothetical protein
MTLDQVLKAFADEFGGGWWWRVGECHRSCDASMGLDKYDPDISEEDVL